MYIYIYIPSVIIHVPPFINHLKITLKVQSSTQTKIKPFYCTKFVTAPVKGFGLVREMPECPIEFSQNKCFQRHSCLSCIQKSK